MHVGGLCLIQWVMIFILLIHQLQLLNTTTQNNSLTEQEECSFLGVNTIYFSFLFF